MLLLGPRLIGYIVVHTDSKNTSFEKTSFLTASPNLPRIRFYRAVIETMLCIKLMHLMPKSLMNLLFSVNIKQKVSIICLALTDSSDWLRRGKSPRTRRNAQGAEW